MYCLELAGEDDAFAAREAESAAVGLDLVAPGLAVAGSVDAGRVRTLAYTRAVGELVARTEASVETAAVALDAAPLRREGTVAVRARDVRGLTGVSTGEAERRLGRVLVDRGFAVDLDDPDHELRALFSGSEALRASNASGETASDGEVGRETGVEAGDDATREPDETGEPTGAGFDEGVCLLHWLEAESVRDFGDRRPTDRPFFQPGSMAPLDARALANVAGAGPGRTLLDPMCGTGGVLIEAGLVGSRVVGSDAQWKMVRGAHENLAHFLGSGGDDAGSRAEFGVLRGDATRLALPDESVQGVVFDAPYGRQSKVARHDLRDLVAGALSEAHRVGDADATCVLMADRSWRDVAVGAGWTLTDLFERRVHRSLTRYVHVLEKRP